MLGLAWMWACLLIGGGFLWSGLTGDSPSPQRLIAASTSSPAPIVAKYETKSIRDIRVGERVLAHNPELSESERADAIEPDQATWRRIQFLMQKPDGGSLEIELLRPVEWLLDHAEQFVESEQPGWFIADQLLNSDQTCERALLGRTIDLDLAELGAAGPAQVISITACPPIEPRNSDNRQVVTGTFKHSAGNVLDLSIAGEPKPIGTTANHPFWSEDRQTFILASELRVGEMLRHADGSITTVTRITPRATVEVVHNLEINSEHVYYVGREGVLVHNSCYATTFFNANPGLKGLVVVHHRVPQAVLTRFPGLFTKTEIHKLTNLTGIPNRLNSTVHLSTINRAWNRFYRNNPNATRGDVLHFADIVDEWVLRGVSLP